MPSTLADGKVLLDAFPFDSNPDLITDVNGYLMGDRSVDAWTMRSAFKQFFSNGVFGTPANAWQIAKGAEGLTVTVQPGMAVIEGAMGGIEDRTGRLTLTLDNQAAAGNLCYGIFLRYDDNADVRGLTVYARSGAAGASPEIPKPDTTSANVYELRLGYVTVPNGATDLTNATVTNEKGLAVCPYAAPFEEIDLDQILSDAKNAADENLVKLLAEFDTYRDVIDAALSEEEATYLQGQINDIKEQLESFGLDLVNEVDDESIEYASDDELLKPKKLRVKDGGVSTAKIADKAVTEHKLDDYLKFKLGILDDKSDWGFTDYYNFASQLTDEEKATLVSEMNHDTISGWTMDEIIQFGGLLPADGTKGTFFGYLTLSDYSWADVDKLGQYLKGDGSSGPLSKFVGQTIPVKTTSYGTINMRCVGVLADDLSDGSGKAPFTFQSTKLVKKMSYTSSYDNIPWKGSAVRTFVNQTFLNDMDAGTSSHIKQVRKNYIKDVSSSNSSGTKATSDDYVWIMDAYEVGHTQRKYNTYTCRAIDAGETIYDWWASHTAMDDLNLDGNKGPWWTRSLDYESDAQGYAESCAYGPVGTDHAMNITGYDPVTKSNTSVVPCFCV